MREFTIECTLSVSGERLTLLANAKRLVPRPPARPLILLTFEDITHRRRHEQEREAMLAELQEMNATLEARVRERIADLNAANEQLQKLSQRVLDAHEAERRHLARELHDEIGQELTGLNMLLHRTSEARGTAFRDALRDSRSIVARLLQQVRRLSIDLRPHVLDDLGLRAAVESHLREFSKRTALPVEFAAEDFAEDSLASGPRTVAFRLVQEALTNAARHAAARHVSIRLRNDDENLFVDVKDDGKGFDPSAHANNGGCGLAGMRERVALAGGQLSIESSPGRGTHVSARLPLCGRPTGGRLK